MIKIRNLSYSIQEKMLLNNINLSFNEGEVVGIIGPSASGKTMLLKTIAGFFKDYSGEILLNGDASSARDLNKNIACMLNNESDIIDDSVFNYLMQSRKSFKKILNPFSDYDIQITENYIKLFQLSDYRDRNILSLSDGTLKKVFLAYPFIKKSDILMLDNPTSGLDMHSIILLQKAISRYVIDGDRIIVLAGNDINFILQTADRIIIMENGKIMEDETPEEINSGLIAKYFNAEVLISKNIYNGKPNIHQYLRGEG